MRNLIYTLLTFSIGSFAFAQPNDFCSGAQTITPNGSCVNSNNTGAADDFANEIGCATTGGPNGHRDVWFRFQATGDALDISGTQGTIGGDLEIILLQSSDANGNGCTGPFTIFDSYCGTGTVTG